ncbi:NAD(P)H-hydrate dehydratase [Gymnodinialimonas sp. 2305UL16-5]|uniref:NAD(P)H-hydrate dehydratase n=1 Tax=Gymnodinialimonas mytili TaxID=3126503 RepID=UPI0030AE6602
MTGKTFMMDVVTSAEMRAIEAKAIASGRVTGLELMERAGQGVVDAIMAKWPDLVHAGHRAVVLCGPGNNGGDGFVIARHLSALGWAVRVLSLGDPDKLPPDARVTYEKWDALGPVEPLSKGLPAGFDEYDLVVDALFGTGLRRPLDGLDELLRAVVRLADDWERGGQGARVVAVDLASGICADSGCALRSPGAYSDASVEANLTVTFHRPKIGHYCADGYAVHRDLVVVDIGLEGSGAVELVTRDRVWLLRKYHLDHKFSNGSALVLTGGFGKTGAARLAARAALRVGAGLVTLGVSGAAQMEVAAQITGLMMTRVDTGQDLTKVLADTRLSALCLGPGLGRDRALDLVPTALAGKGRPVVLDADALTAFEDDPDHLFALLHKHCVLTPHEGEFRRLFPDLAVHEPATTGPAYSSVDAVRQAAKRSGCVVLLKGPATVIADEKGECRIHSAQYDREAPWLATAGSGDVLAGLITGLLARNTPALEAAATAAWLHVEAARTFGPGLIAEDIPDILPHVLSDLDAE